MAKTPAGSWPASAQTKKAQSLGRLGIKLPAGPRGGPIFDGYGRIVGVALAASAGGDSFITVSQIREALDLPLDRSTPRSSSASFPLDEGYELAMRVSLQVIVR